MAKYIVTGASGFIGKALVKKLAYDKKNIVFAVVRNKNSDISEFSNIKNINTIICELNNISLLYEILKDEKIDSFIHLAWEGSTGMERANYDIQMKNIIYTANAYKISEKLGCKKFLCSGTISEHIINQIKDLHSISQNMIYALAKKNTKELLRILSKQSSVQMVWMQFSNVYGPHNRSGNLISYTMNEIKKGAVPEFGSGMQPYNFIYIDDLVDAIICLEKSEFNKDNYFIGSGENILLKEYLQMIPKVMGKNITLGIGKRPDDGIVYKSEWFNIDDILNDTSYKPFYSFENGLKKMFEVEGEEFK